MGCFRLSATLLVFCTVCAYILAQLLVVDWREGAVGRIGIGLPRTWTAEGTSGGTRILRLPSGATLHTLEGPSEPRMSFLLVHDITEHGGAMGELAQVLFKQCEMEGYSCAVFAVDLPGHGHCRDTCGIFTMQQMVDAVRDASSWIREQTREGAVFTLGQGIGGEIALQAGFGHEPITGTISNGLLLPAHLHPREQVRLFGGWVGEVLSLVMGSRQICAAALINFQHIFDKVQCPTESSSSTACTWQHDAPSYERSLRDPHSQWFFTVSSLRSLFTYQAPKSRREERNKPVLVFVGAQDKSLPLEHIRLSFERIKGAKALRFTMAAGHQLVRQEAEKTAKLVIPWTNAVLDGTHGAIRLESDHLYI